MTASVEGFLSRFGREFLDVTESQLTLALEEALLIHGARELATYYLMAHLLVLARAEGNQADGGAGVITDEQIGPKTTSYQNMTVDQRDVFFATTPYGRRFLVLERKTPRFGVGASVVRSGRAQRW